jgi:hypothetical protein
MQTILKPQATKIATHQTQTQTKAIGEKIYANDSSFSYFENHH